MDQVALSIPKTRVSEGDNFTVTAYFRDRASGTADAPTTVEYRIDCLTTGREVQDWATLTAGESVSIALASDYSAIINRCNEYERKQLTVMADRDLPFQRSGQVFWTVKNLGLPPT
jgi:hypothetical protein